MTRWDWLEASAFAIGIFIAASLAGVSAAQDAFLVTAICIAAVLGAVSWMVWKPAE